MLGFDLSWFSLFTGFSITTIIIGALIFFFMPFLMPMIGNFFAPIAGAFGKIIGKVIEVLGKALIYGFTDIFDSPKTILTFFISIFLVSGYVHLYGESSFKKPTYAYCKPVVDKEIKSLRKRFIFVKRKR